MTGPIASRTALIAGLLLVLACGSDSGGSTEPDPAALHLVVHTTGSDLDPDGYQVVVNGTPLQSIPSNFDSTFAGLSSGAISVTLTGVAANCVTSTTFPLSASLVSGQTTTINISFVCSAIPATTGNLQLNVSTTGPDADGYTIRVDLGTTIPIGRDTALLLSGIPIGSHQVAFRGIEPNCTLAGDSTRSLAVVSGTTTTASFPVTCTPNRGTLHLTVTTTGVAPDPDGYSLSLDGVAQPALGINSSVDLQNVLVGNRTLLLGDLASNCHATTNPQTVLVQLGLTTSVNFQIACPGVESIRVITSTQGLSQDPDGYSLTVDSQTPISIRGLDTVLVSGLLAGSHSLSLGGVQSNCAPGGANPVQLTITPGVIGNANFAVQCSYTPKPRAQQILFTRLFAAQPGDENTSDVYSIGENGGALTPVLVGLGRAFQASWSPDGTQLIYVLRRNDGSGLTDIRVRNADGSGDRLLTPGAYPAWSPSGKEIAFVDTALSIIAADGTGGSHRVGINLHVGASPSWSPEGARLAVQGAFGDIVIINTDGTRGYSIQPPIAQVGNVRWSPDGNWIAFDYLQDGFARNDVALIRPDGSDYRVVAGELGDEDRPTWSPDGTSLAYSWANASIDRHAIYKVLLSGGAPVKLTEIATPTIDIDPSWGP